MAPNIKPCEKPPPAQLKSPPTAPPPPMTLAISPPTYNCRRCHEVFPTNIQLHRHIRSSRHSDRSASAKNAPPATTILPPRLPATPLARTMTSSSVTLPIRKPSPARKSALQQQRLYTRYNKPMGSRGGSQYFEKGYRTHGAGNWKERGYSEPSRRSPLSRPPACGYSAAPTEPSAFNIERLACDDHDFTLHA